MPSPSVRRLTMAAISNSLSLKHSFSLSRASPSSSSIKFKFRRCYAAFANENREYVIVGGGNAAGYAARTFVEHGMADGRLCIVTKEPYAPYERPALTKAYLFPPDKKPARLPGFHTCVGSGGERQTPGWYKENGIEMLYEDPVKDIDIEKHTLTTSSGKLLKYGSLVIATGCTASRFPEKIGGNLPGVHYIRDVGDADALILSLEKAKKVVVVGGGYIGMEVAAAAVGWKLDTTIIFPEDHLLQRLFTPSLARRYEELYQKNGVKILKGASIKNLEAGSNGHVAAVKLGDGSLVEADTVIIGIGAKPAVTPFERVGLNTEVGGIQVDGQFRIFFSHFVGVGGYYYLLEPLWWVGMITMIVGEVANFVAYAFAPAVLVTPLGALSIIVSAVLADIILKEKLHNLGILGCIMCIAGSIIIVIHAPKEQPITSVLEIWNMATQPAFLAYVGSVIVLVFILVFHFAPRCGHTNVLVFTGICSLMGSLSVMSVKALGTSLKLTFEGKNQLIYPETWFFMLVVAICVIMQMNYLNKALDTFNTAIVSPIYYVMFTTLTILASVIMFKDWDGQSGGTIVSEICGFIIVLSGTIMLHATKDFERSSSFRGSDPLSPTLSARLFTGNGDSLLKQDEENGSPESNMRSRRQELY